jgi:hypothetical protein
VPLSTWGHLFSSIGHARQSGDWRSLGQLRVRVSRPARVPEGGDGGVGCGGYFPGDGLTDDGERKDADDAKGAKNRDDVRKPLYLGF